MSLINQVLNQLEQRGAHTSSEQTMVRAVPLKRKQNLALPVLVVAVIALLAGAGWYGFNRMQHKEMSPAVSGAIKVAPSVLEADNVLAGQLQPAGKMSYELSLIPPPAEAVIEVAEPAPVVLPPKVTPARTVREERVSPKPSPRPATSVVAELPLKQVSRTQQADAEYRKAIAQQQQGHFAEALAGYDAAIQLNEQHDAARLALVSLLVQSRRGGDAERVLREGLRLKPEHTVFSMALARVEVELGNVKDALATLEHNLQQADDKADYQAFYAALLQREGRHKEALNNYQVALELAPDNGIWQMGYAISLQALQRNEDAKVAYQKALATKTLSPELTAFVQQKLKSL